MGNGPDATVGNGINGQRSPASPNLGLGRLPGLCLDEVVELTAHEQGFDFKRPSPQFEGWAEQFLTGYVKGYRRALFQVTTARFGRSSWYEDALWALTDLREIVQLLDRVPTAVDWKDVLQPLYDRKRAEVLQRVSSARTQLLAAGTERFGQPDDDVQRRINGMCYHNEYWRLERLLKHHSRADGWPDLLAREDEWARLG